MLLAEGLRPDVFGLIIQRLGLLIGAHLIPAHLVIRQCQIVEAAGVIRVLLAKGPRPDVFGLIVERLGLLPSGF